MTFHKAMLIPKLIWYGLRAPKDQATAWNRYWSGIRRTGFDGEVLWDAGSEAEINQSLAHLREHMDHTLPIIDLGCGNGRHARMLASHFPRVVGIDISHHAIERARQETQGTKNISYQALDATRPSVGSRLAHEFGEMNVYLRGVLHVLAPEQRVPLVQNLRDMLGQRGTLYLLETNHSGSPLDYMLSLGANAVSIPKPLLRCVQAGLRTPDHFGEREYTKYFPAQQWETLNSGTTVIYGVPMRQPNVLQPIPGFFALARRKRS